MDAISGLCEGCLRTIEEIVDWAALDERGKRAVWTRLHERRALRANAAAAMKTQADGAAR